MAWMMAGKGALTLGEILLGTGVAAAGAGVAGANILSGKGGSGDSFRPSATSGGILIDRSGNIPEGSSKHLTALAATHEIQNAIGKLIGSTASSSIRYRYPRGQSSNMIGIKVGLTQNPTFIEDIVKILGKTLPTVGSSADIIATINADNAKRQAFLDALKALKIPDAPTFTLGSGTSTASSTYDPNGDPDDPGSGPNAVNELKDKINQTAQTGTESSAGEVTKTIGKNTNANNTKTRTKTDTKTKTKTETEEEEEEKKRPEPPRDPRDPEPPDFPELPEEKPKSETNITERPVSDMKKRMNAPQQWMPQYTFGGQNLLKLTDVEKLEELRNYTLFDLVNPLLIGDDDNLLALQNKIQENRRFTNTYPNPRPERQMVPPKNIESWRQPMRSIYPTPYPMSESSAHQQLYYDKWNNQDYHYQAKNIDAIARGATFDPDLEQVLNAKRDSYTATDPRIMKHTSTAKPSLLENLDSGSITALDLMMLR
jgi:hypothetical protein